MYFFLHVSTLYRSWLNLYSKTNDRLYYYYYYFKYSFFCFFTISYLHFSFTFHPLPAQRSFRCGRGVAMHSALLSTCALYKGSSFTCLSSDITTNSRFCHPLRRFHHPSTTISLTLLKTPRSARTVGKRPAANRDKASTHSPPPSTNNAPCSRLYVV